MWLSVPHSDVDRTRRMISSSPGTGSGTVFSSRPGAGAAFMTAFMRESSPRDAGGRRSIHALYDRRADRPTGDHQAGPNERLVRAAWTTGRPSGPGREVRGWAG